MSENPNVTARTPELPVSLADLGSSILEEARAADSGHAAVTLTPAEGGQLKQTLVAVEAGNALDPTHWNGPGSVQVIVGRASVSGLDRAVSAGGWTTVPTQGGEITAEQDLVALLTVAPG